MKTNLPRGASPVGRSPSAGALVGGVAGAIAEGGLSMSDDEIFSMKVFFFPNLFVGKLFLYPFVSELVLWQPALLKFTMEKSEKTDKNKMLHKFPNK